MADIKNKKLSRLKQSPYLFLLLFLIVPVVGLWQLTFMQYTMKWDIMDQVFPWRYFISEGFRNGYLPLWNPYQSLGYPIYADPQSGFWYPLVWIISFISGYSVYTINLEYLLHLIIAGGGMYYLIKSLNINHRVSLLIAIVYQGSGFFISNAQHLSWIISAAWLPWVLYGFIKFLNDPGFRTSLLFTFFFAMMFTGGYPAFAIITTYILLVLIILKIIRRAKNGNLKAVRNIILYQLLSVGIFLLITMGYIVSFFQALPHITREETNLQQALTGHFSVKAIFTFIFPFSTAKSGFYGSDVSLINIYIGILILIFFIYALVIRKQTRFWVLLIAGIIALMAAFGAAFPVREWLFHYVPLMDKFRFPALFRLFTIITFLILAAVGISKYFYSGNKKKKLFIGISLGTSLLILLAISISISKKVSLIIPPIWSPKLYLERIADATLPDLVLIQGIIQLLFIGSLLIILYQKWDMKKKFNYFFGLVLLDVLLAIQINVPLTVISDARPVEVQRNIDQLPDGFPIPDNAPIVTKSDYQRYIYPMWYNMGIFHKITAFDGYDPFMLKNYNELYDSPLRDSLLNHPLIYFKENNSLMIKDFGPGKIKAEMDVSSKDTLIYSQTFYPGWKVYIDGEEKEIFQTNIALMATVVEPGASEIKFKYEPPLIRLLFYTSVGTFLLLIISLIVLKVRSLQHRLQDPV